MQTQPANLPANDDVGAALTMIAALEGVDFTRLEARARIDEHAEYTRRLAKREGRGSPCVIQSAAHVIRLIRGYRANFG